MLCVPQIISGYLNDFSFLIKFCPLKFIILSLGYRSNLINLTSEQVRKSNFLFLDLEGKLTLITAKGMGRGLEQEFEIVKC